MSSRSSDSEGLAGVDIARGLAAISVFVYHYNPAMVLTKYTGQQFGWISVPGATLAVPLFFLISGFCIHYSQARSGSSSEGLNLRNYFRRRFWRLYPAYLVALCFSCSVNSINGGAGLPLDDFLVHVFMLQSISIRYFNTINVVLWTISVEVMLYCLYPIWHWVRRRWGMRVAMSLGATATGASWFVFSFVLFPYDVAGRWFVFNLWAGWLFGAWLAEEYVKNSIRLYSRAWILAGVGVICFTIMMKLAGVFDGRGLVLQPTAIILAWAWPFMALVQWQSQAKLAGVLALLRRGAIALGQCSYSLYLLHEPLISLRNALWSGVENQFLRMVIYIFWFAVILLCSWLSFKLFESPGMAFGRQRRPSSDGAAVTA